MSDLISRQDAIETSLEFFVEFLGGAFYENAQKELIAKFQRLPSAQPEPSDSVYRLYKRAYEAGQRNAQPELHFDEWCSDCKEFDQERHCCPRWNKVIRETLKDTQSPIIHCRDCKYAHITYGGEVKYCDIWFPDESHYIDTDNYCSFAERREE